MAEESDGKKEKVLHTRVSEGLEKALKEKASQLGLSMSTLVRNVLGATVEVVGEAMLDGVRPDAPTGPILGYQPLTLARNALCDGCNAILPRATTGWLAVGGEGTTVVCEPCVEHACGGEE